MKPRMTDVVLPPREPISMQQAVEDCGWLGPVIGIHTIGPYDIVEYWHQPSSNSPDRNTYRNFSLFIDGKKTGCSFDSLDEALAGGIARRHDGINTRADGYFIRGIGADLPAESRPIAKAKGGAA